MIMDSKIENKEITNLVDYVFGIEVGLDTNARKNRSGDHMQSLVSDIFTHHSINFRKQVWSTELTGLSILGEDVKQFDFLIQTTPVPCFARQGICLFSFS